MMEPREQNPPTPGNPRVEDYVCHNCGNDDLDYIRVLSGRFLCAECGSHTFEKRRSLLVKRLQAV